MKKPIVYLLCLLIAFIISFVVIPKIHEATYESPFAQEESAKGKNVKISTCSDSHVYFKPVCPECGHISGMYSVNLSSGEKHSTNHICEQCYEVYEITIER